MRISSLAILTLLLGNFVSAQDTVPNIKNTILDLSVPDSPAFTVLGLTPSEVTHPASPRLFASSLLSGVDQNGNFQTGVAIDTAPYMLFYGNGVTLPQYRQSRLIRFLTRTQFSFATAKGTSDSDKSARFSAGLSLTIFDKGDARLDSKFTDSLAATAASVMNDAPPLSPTADATTKAERKKDLEDQVEAKTQNTREVKRKALWNRSSWVIAGAPSWISQDGTNSHISPDGAAVWSSLAYGFEGVPGLKDKAQVIIHARFHSSETVPDPLNSGQFFKQQSEVFGAKIRYGTENTIGSFETVYIHTAPIARTTEKFFRLTVAAERRITDDVWLHFGIGGESGQKNGEDKLFILGTFKWGAGPK